MRDPLTWSLPLGRVFGILIRVHVLFPFMVLGIVLHAGLRKNAIEGDWKLAAGVMLLLFVSVLLHEFGHCFGARFVDGDAQEILMWPLGGLAYVEVPHTAWANFITVAAGPLVNALLCMLSGAVLTYHHLDIPWNLFKGYPYSSPEEFWAWQGWLQRFFFVNWLGFLFNVLLPAFPLDGGRLVQCALWPRYGFRQATMTAVYFGFVTALGMGVYSIIAEDNAIVFFMLALFIYFTCRQQYIILEHGSEDSLFGYDFSQGYTSLERDQPPRRRRPNVIQRWLARRAARKMQLEMEQREAEERRMDELLEKVQREGLQALTDEERRFLTRVSAKYRNRQ
jgi:stage IV sporulation protein FB